MSAKFMKNAFVGWTMSAGTYYPPDFDASKLMPVKHLRPKGINPEMRNIRMMFPFTMICDHCGEYNYTGTKFTAKVEPIKSEAYLGLKVYRFYGHCKHCWSEFTFKTDPKNSAYSMESGGRRTYEAWKDADMAEMQLKQEKAAEAERDAMAALEQKSIDVQAEIQRIEDLDAIRSLNKRNGGTNTIEEALEWIFKKKEEEALEEQVRLSDGELKEMRAFINEREDSKRRKLDEAIENGDSTGSTAAPSSKEATSSSTSASAVAATASARDAAIAAAVRERASSQTTAKRKAPTVVVVKKKTIPPPMPQLNDKEADEASTSTGGGGGMGLLGGYESSDE